MSSRVTAFYERVEDEDGNFFEQRWTRLLGGLLVRATVSDHENGQMESACVFRVELWTKYGWQLLWEPIDGLSLTMVIVTEEDVRGDDVEIANAVEEDFGTLFEAARRLLLPPPHSANVEYVLKPLNRADQIAETP